MEGLLLATIFSCNEHLPCQKAGWPLQSAAYWTQSAQQPEEPLESSVISSRRSLNVLCPCDAADPIPGLVNFLMILKDSMKEPGQPCEKMSGMAFGSEERSCRKCSCKA